LTRPTGSSKYGKTRKNIQRYHTPKQLIRYIEKRGFVLLGSETQKLTNCEHAIVQRVVSFFFFSQLNSNKLTRRLHKEYVGRKVKNAPEVNLRRNFVFARTPSFSPKVITWLEPAIQWKNQSLVRGQVQKHTHPQ